jgi:hypothetical protein
MVVATVLVEEELNQRIGALLCDLLSPRTELGTIDLLLPLNPAAMAVRALLPSSSSGGRLGTS